MTSPDSIGLSSFTQEMRQVSSSSITSKLLTMIQSGMSRKSGVIMVLEFKNSIMKEFCKEKEITHNFLAPMTPQQNGVVERKNRTLIEVARTVLEESKLPTYFWAEIINTACYTQNISIVNQTQGKTPYQLMKNNKPTLNFLFMSFGANAFVLRNEGENLGKFKEKANEALFVGYATTRAYRVYNLRMNIVMESVHMVFDDKKIQGLVDERNHDTL